MNTYEKFMLGIVTIGFTITIALLLEIWQQTVDNGIFIESIHDWAEFSAGE